VNLPTAAELEAAFESVDPLTIGIEEEVMLLDPETHDLWPHAAELLDRLDGDSRFKPELPASQVEIVVAPSPSSEQALAALAQGRRDLADAADGLTVPAAIAVHPFAATEGELASSERYNQVHAEYGPVARRQLVAALQIHVAVSGAERTLAVYNSLRSRLPEIAAIAASAPFRRGRDTGLASVRPKLAELLPRQGMPPPVDSWQGFADDLRWGAAAGTVADPTQWWWELRPHTMFGTLEVRVPDAQSAFEDAAGVVGLVYTLIAWLAERHDRGESLGIDPTWRIEENRWSAARWGVEGQMADLRTGRPEPTRERLLRLLDELASTGDRLGTTSLLAKARKLVGANGAIAQRDVFSRGGMDGLMRWVTARFVE
jgi:carboxylate-amine ligase